MDDLPQKQIGLRLLEDEKVTQNYAVDLVKFISALLIVYYHRYILGYERLTYPLSDTWIFVELFLMITGYFTYAHFLQEDDTHIVRYTVYKIKRLMPYVLVTVLASYFVVNFSLFRTGDLRGAIH